MLCAVLLHAAKYCYMLCSVVTCCTYSVVTVLLQDVRVQCCYLLLQVVTGGAVVTGCAWCYSVVTGCAVLLQVQCCNQCYMLLQVVQCC